MVRTPRPNDPKVQSGVSMLLRKCSIFGPRPGVRLASPFSLHPRRGQCREREETRSREERQEKRKDKHAIAICKCVQQSKAVHSKFPTQNPKWGSGGKAADWRKYVILREISVSKGEV